MRKKHLITGFALALGMLFIKEASAQSSKEIKLITLDPGHFHAALVQKNMYPEVSPEVHVYAPAGTDLDFHLQRIQGYNTRKDNPTQWQEKVYTGNDYLERMLADKAGNVVVIAGNNRIKADYLQKSVNAGFNVLADKPMIINCGDFEQLKQTFAAAAQKNVLLYDIMTERYEISTMLQREFSMLPGAFGKLEKGTPDNPAVTKESVHHFYKYVSGSVLTRPAWFMDIAQQGEGIVDVNTHLVDLIQWECFPNQVIDYKKDIRINDARHWTTDMTLSQFKAITKLSGFPDYLKKDVVKDTLLKVFCNGEINYQLKGVHAKASVIWAYQAPEGGGDTHYSIMRGTKANLIIRQGAEQNYKPTLYIEPVTKAANYETDLMKALAVVQKQFPGVSLKKIAKGWEVEIPERYKEGHEAHFGRVTEKYLEFLKQGKLPAWEVPNMLAKYYTTTQALKVATKTR
ncbi:putative oxidoreductase C-terminal domain-containing protein [Emticicia sp. 21SJ11W-3]|uniref:putative oxidoreductase C-terminal domain-containing protein n=1 Tax=Emticicia sp. 21SJ11W-3 TaxID=2916755 RepID=UPI0038D44AD2